MSENIGISNSNDELQNKNLNRNKQEFDGMVLTALLFRYKVFVILFVVVLTSTSVVISLFLDNWYSSSANLVPPKKSSSMLEGALGNVTSALKEFGLNKLGGSGDGSYSYLVVLESRTVKDSIIKKYNLAKVYEMEDVEFSKVRNQFQDNLEIDFEKEGNYTITIYDKDPIRAANMANDYVNIANQVSINVFRSEAKVNREYIESRINATDSAISYLSNKLSQTSKKNLIFSPEEQSKAISSAIIDLKAELMKQEITMQILKNSYGENDPYTQMQKNLITELRSKVADAETKPGFGGNFSLKDAASIGIDFLRIYAELQAYIKVKAFLLPMLEDIKIDEFRNINNLYFVDKAIPADKKAYPKRSLIVAGTALGSFTLAAIILLLINGFKNFKSHYQEFIKP